ncbi:MAG: hypothetical protein EKK54_05530 [Neisseriaceae bacterium]|nr:MAG: hypothetical protein EKK54_05530 [Neisseriaceae bacterium]
MKILKHCLTLLIPVIVTACNGGGASGDSPAPTPTQAPTPTPTTIAPLQVEVVQQTADLGTVNWIDLRKVGSTTNFKLKFTNTNSVPVGFYGDSIVGESKEQINFLNLQINSMHNIYFANNSSTDSSNCAYYQLLNGYKTTESGKTIYNWQNGNSMLNPGQSCYFNVFAYSFLNMTESDIFNVALYYNLHTSKYDPNGLYNTADYTKYYESNIINMKLVKLTPVNDTVTKSVFWGSSPTISLDGKYAATSSVSGSNVTVTRYNVSYDNVNGLNYTSPITFVVPNCNYAGYGGIGAASLSPTGDAAFVSCSYSDQQWVQIWKINSDATAQYESYLNYYGAYWISGFDYNVYATPSYNATAFFKFNNNSYQFSSTGLINPLTYFTSEINTDGTIIQANGSYNWQCLNSDGSVVPLTGLGDNFNVYNYNNSDYLTNLDTARLSIKLQYPSIPIEQYSDGTVFKYQPNLVGLAKVNTSNGNCYIESNNFINTTQTIAFYITPDYVAIPYDGTIYVTSSNNLAK